MANFIPEQEKYKELTPFKLHCLTQFPYIEADFDAITNYGLLSKIVEYLNNVIDNENKVENNVSGLYNAYVSLQGYVNDYFENLDVQDEINNKLDQMAQDGSLYEIIRQYTDPIVNQQNNRISTIEDTINSVASGSPAGIYATIAELQSADPDHSKIYVVTDNGNWYFWNTATSQWKNGGVYQASQVGTGSISYENLNTTLKDNISLIPVDYTTDAEDGYIINTTPQKFPYEGYSISKPIKLKQGETICIETCNNTVYMIPIAVVNYNLKQEIIGYTPVSDHTLADTTNYYQFSYTAKYRDEDVILSYKNDKVRNVYISKNYTYNSENVKDDYFTKNQYNLINSSDNYTSINATRTIVDNDDPFYKKTLKVNINYTGTQSSGYKFSIVKNFSLQTGIRVHYGFCYVDIKKNSNDDVPMYFTLLNKEWGIMSVDKPITISNSEYTRFYLPFYSQNGCTSSTAPLRVTLGMRDIQRSDITSLQAEVEIREFGIIYNRFINNSIDTLYTPYDILSLAKSSNNGIYENTNISIIGDSYSTYKDWIPNNYPYWYSDTSTSEPNNVNDVKQTWWHQLLKELKASLLINNSYSGSTICNSGYNGQDATATSFITRTKIWVGEQRKTNTKPNVIIIMGGLNDTWAGTSVGSQKYSDWTANDLKQVIPGFCYLIDYLQKWNPGCKIINVVVPNISSDIKSGMATACTHYGIKNIQLSNISVESSHPNQAGMEEIKNQIINNL